MSNLWRRSHLFLLRCDFLLCVQDVFQTTSRESTGKSGNNRFIEFVQVHLENSEMRLPWSMRGESTDASRLYCLSTEEMLRLWHASREDSISIEPSEINEEK